MGCPQGIIHIEKAVVVPVCDDDLLLRHNDGTSVGDRHIDLYGNRSVLVL